jgi:SP family facilitated glucose transporter-like MFS transporter 8
MQIFAMHIEGRARSLVTLVSWLGSWIGSYAFNFLLLWSSYGKHVYNTEMDLVIKDIDMTISRTIRLHIVRPAGSGFEA